MSELFWSLVSIPLAIAFIWLVKYLQAGIIYCVLNLMCWITGPWARPREPVPTARQELEELRERLKNKGQ